MFKEGYKTLTSQVYADDDVNLETDVQFGVTRALVGHFQRHDEAHPSEPDVSRPWYTLDYTFVMEPGEAGCRARRSSSMQRRTRDRRRSEPEETRC